MISEQDILRARILIVDDQEANTELLTQVLAGAGYTAVSAINDPKQVCELYRRNHYDLIMLDLLMPGMDGFQVMEKLKEVETEGYVPVLAITAEPAHKLRALQSGAKDFISKPFDLAEVTMRVHNMLEVRLSHQAAREHGKVLESWALKDALTGLANRRLLSDRMSVAIVHARRNKSAMAVMYLDLDGFKQVNDTLGHAGGDTLLKTVSGRLVSTVREEDTVARLGGDEFVIALWHVTGPEDAARVASKMIDAIGQPYNIDGHALHLTTSVGVAIYPVHGEDEETLMKNADRALYAAKHAGKNAYRISDRNGSSRSDFSSQSPYLSALQGGAGAPLQSSDTSLLRR